MMNIGSTICAVATAQGGAISVIRISGPQAIQVTDRIFKPAKGMPFSERAPYSVSYGRIIDSEGSVVDEVVTTLYRAPKSYTGEDCTEIACHGSTYIANRILALLIAAGCCTAQPGEFTQRAFLNGKMDLSQAEAVADLIASTSAATHRLAMNQMRGGFSKELSALRDKLLRLTSLMELELDFSDHEELEFADRSELEQIACNIEQVISRLAESFSVGNAIKNGIPVAIIGETNAGKSTLLNRLLNEDKAIVSDIHGTTRDVIEDTIVINGVMFRFIDTAGIRQTSDVEDRIEKFSVIRANMAVERADVCLLMIDANDGVTEQDEKIAGLAHEAGKACIIVINKWDSIEKENNTVNQFNKEIRTALAYMPYAPIIYVSALTGQRCANIYKMINEAYEQANRRITTGMLNDLLNDAQNRVQPPSDKGKRLKIYYMTQTSVAPPTFVIFCNNEELFHFSYRRYIENCIRDTFGFEGTPIRMIIRQKGDDSTKV